MNTAVKSYLLYDSPLKTRKGKAQLSLILALVFAFAVLGRFAIGAPTLLTTYAWVPYSLLGSLGAYAIFWFLDRKRSVRWFHLLVMLTVALQTCFAAAFFNTHSPYPLQTVGYIEEFFKILPVLLLAIFTPNLIRTKKDGIVYGGLAGIGFNVLEIGLYISRGMEGGQTMMETLWTQSTRFAVLGFGCHVIWSMFVGYGLGASMESSKRGFAKWKTFILIYLLVGTMHSLFDSFMLAVFLMLSFAMVNLVSGNDVASKIQIEETKKPGLLHHAMVLEHFLYNIVLLFILLRVLFKSAKAEQEIYVRELADEGPGVISAEEKIQLAKERRFGFRKYKGYRRRLSVKIVKRQNMLAMQKHAISKGGGNPEASEEVRLLRQDIADLKRSAA